MGYTTTTCITRSAFPNDKALRLSDEVPACNENPGGSLETLSAIEQIAIDRFCDQCLQLEPTPDYPDGGLLKRADVQNEIFNRICADHPEPLPGNARLQLRTLKELVRRIQASISDEEVDEYEVSDSIMNQICQLVLVPQVSEFELAQMKSLVTYRLSLLKSASQIYIHENRSLIAAGGATGHRTWEAALHLGQYLCLNRHLVECKRVLELGAGTGYNSVLCAKHLGAAHVLASDGSEEVLENLCDNFALNDCAYNYNSLSDTPITPKLLKWGHALMGTEEPEWNGGQPIDVILGADITYDQNANPALASTLRELFDLYPDAEVILSVTDRNPETFSLFRDLCRKNQLRVAEFDFTDGEQHEQLQKLASSGQRARNLTPYYHSPAPIRLLRVSRIV
ncbi:hypothetical protein N0V93_000612 [Gnomoniopsis smithogilvyi]|uniref:Uncharacterized protein n=1 Tax=Gnomoniopsis smithogilvyi TaxID=1191159 RepID=A0A9W9D0V9_9PEZI|nr:hypothetical protein N0V93_000612 [Gnomoniopsis smithogilvyi]